MAGARGDALEWALALAEAPGERHALRQRPLPDGVDVLLRIAGGSDSAAMAEAVQRTGLAAPALLDAARFYLREVLFFPEADAYRVLGLSADASDEQIKQHHRWLQQWLHPDRPTSEWDAAFAARVNAAWSQLRTPERREAYVASVQVVASPDPIAEPAWVPPARLPSASFEGAVEDAGSRWRRRAPVLALFGVCAVLGLLVLRDMQREPEDALPGFADEEVAASEQAVALTLPTPAADATAPAPRAAARAKPAVAKPEPSANPFKRALAALTTPSKPAAPPVREVAPRPAAGAAPASIAATKPPPRADREVVPPVPVAAALTTVVHEAAIVPTSAPAVAKAPPPVLAVAPPPAPKPARPPAATSTSVPVAVRSEPVAVAPPPPSPAIDPISARRAAQVQETGQRLLTYLSARRGGVPPIWANLTAQQQASQARSSLQEAGRISVSQREWRIGDDTATLRASLSPRQGAARSLRVDLVWRDQRWLVSKLDLGS